MAALATPRNAGCVACVHRHVDATPGGMRHTDVHARDQLLGVATSVGRVVTRRGGRREASRLGRATT